MFSATALPARPPATAPMAAPTAVPIGPTAEPATAPAAIDAPMPAAPPTAAPMPVPTGCEPGAPVIGSGLRDLSFFNCRLRSFESFMFIGIFWFPADARRRATPERGGPRHGPQATVSYADRGG